MPRLIVLIAVLVIMITGCTGGSMKPIANKSTMTKDEALSRVNELINDSVSIIEPKPTLELDPTTLTLYHCLGQVGDNQDGRIYVSRAYYLRGIPKDKDTLADVARRVRRHWEQRGHFIQGVSRNGLNIAARSRPDDFILALSWTPGDVLMIEVSSVCVWPNGTPEPTPSSDLDGTSKDRQTP